jgi:putative phosphoesterase
MKLLVISDLHANASALASVEAETADAIVFLGDSVSYGTRPVECIDWLRSHATWAVKGNHDDALASGIAPRSRPKLSDAARSTLSWHRKLVREDQMDYLRRLPYEIHFHFSGRDFFATHASPRRLDEYLDSDEAILAAVAEVPADVVLLGHTHRRVHLEIPGKVIVNPGSLGQPRSREGTGSYAVFERGRVRFRDAAYDLKEIEKEYETSPLSSDVSRQLVETLAPQSGPVADAPV